VLSSLALSCLALSCLALFCRCGVAVVNEKLQVGLLLTGLVDAAAEIKKAEKNMEPLKKSFETLDTKMNDAKYEKTPDNVREQDKARQAATLEKIKALEAVIAGFQALMI
jgi:valyl-tRNA synthetase